MDREEILNLINSIGTCEDETERRTMLNNMRDSIGELFDTNESLNSQNSELTSANEKLRSANTDLFLQLGNKSANGMLQNQAGEPEPPKEPRKYENLFNEKGELK